MPSIKFSDAAAALFAALQSAPALSGVTILDGAVPAAQYEGDFVIAGHDGSLDAGGALSEISNAGSFSQNFVAQQEFQEEQGTINCVAVSNTGDTSDVAGRLAQVVTLAAAAGDAMTDFKSGTIVFDSANTGTAITRQSGAGTSAMLAFTITYSSPW